MVRDKATSSKTSSKFPLSPDLAYAVHCQAKVLGRQTQSLNLIKQSLTAKTNTFRDSDLLILPDLTEDIRSWALEYSSTMDSHSARSSSEETSNASSIIKVVYSINNDNSKPCLEPPSSGSITQPQSQVMCILSARCCYAVNPFKRALYSLTMPHRSPRSSSSNYRHL